MVFSTWSGLNVAYRGLTAAQRGLDVTGHNITNANTPGFTRQRATLVAATPLAYPSLLQLTPGQLGQGVEIPSILRLRDEFLDQTFRRQNSGLGTHDSQVLAFNQLESLLNEPTDFGISTQLAEFFRSWNDLANTPESLPTRTALRERTTGLLTTFKSVKGQLDALRAQQDVQIQTRSTEVNRKFDQIAELNRQIGQVEGTGQQANDLKDRRDLLIDEVSKVIALRVIPAPNGVVDLIIGGVKVVEGPRAQHLETFTDPQNPQAGLQLRFDQARVPVPIEGGELAGYYTIRDVTIPQIESRLNALASTLVNRINLIHKAHYGLDGITGRAYFAEVITQTRSGTVDLANGFAAPVNEHTTLAELGITAGEFTVQGTTIRVTAEDVDPQSGLTLGGLLQRINNDQSTVRGRIQSDYRGTFVTFDLYNPPDRDTTIQVRDGTSNALAVLGQIGATNVDTAQRATYRGALLETQLNPLIREDSGIIAAAGELFPGQFAGEGDNQGALRIAELEDRLDLFAEGGGFTGFFNSTVAFIGSLAQTNQRQVLNQGALTEQAFNQRLSVSGVNLDEEAVELIKFQKAYEASARIVTTLQSIYDTILGMVR